VKQAIHSGIQWIQIRIKNKDPLQEDLETIRQLCKKARVTCILNDYVELARTFDFDGVHLGKKDMSPETARKFLGENKIIGTTANTWEDILRLSHQPIDYIGLGPFRFTRTKDQLSPILGLEGYQQIMEKISGLNIKIPVIAIGGILPEDIKPLMRTGIHGIAVSSGVHGSGNFFENVVKYVSELKEVI
jgi:thiamine-phosphate pyrophosphorylase